MVAAQNRSIVARDSIPTRGQAAEFLAQSEHRFRHDETRNPALRYYIGSRLRQNVADVNWLAAHCLCRLDKFSLLIDSTCPRITRASPAQPTNEVIKTISKSARYWLALVATPPPRQPVDKCWNRHQHFDQASQRHPPSPKIARNATNEHTEGKHNQFLPNRC